MLPSLVSVLGHHGVFIAIRSVEIKLHDDFIGTSRSVRIARLGIRQSGITTWIWPPIPSWKWLMQLPNKGFLSNDLGMIL